MGSLILGGFYWYGWKKDWVTPDVVAGFFIRGIVNEDLPLRARSFAAASNEGKYDHLYYLTLVNDDKWRCINIYHSSEQSTCAGLMSYERLSDLWIVSKTRQSCKVRWAKSRGRIFIVGSIINQHISVDLKCFRRPMSTLTMLQVK